ncbi:hypothetical protein DAPPUDRAFT_263684 [Daphnia pulex]|uniref:Uncharacterized protein n=1 Tax=Daphnia pulex TaxID=6669 RepID=E9HQ88_DAPPU|nr:hypothetical protein DAPPUDRAFT_263684 [Daphnia pulex]|eukprot:EFX66080.1 hypothetical protein DAPPUDRAFT_263684 [Daphnia pulex]
MNVLADIVSTINDHSAGNFTPSHVPRTTNILVNAEELSLLVLVQYIGLWLFRPRGWIFTLVIAKDRAAKCASTTAKPWSNKPNNKSHVQ